ncbi:MAG TPA: hypothetical protein VJM11_16100 [Nevskiaceae bacterium]|nr:hypothetical protein [Nevskiaceae bacterium]
MSCIRAGLAAIAVAAGLGMSGVGAAADDDAVFFTSEDCSGTGYVWAPADVSAESIGWTRAAAPERQVVGPDRLVFVADPASSPAMVEYHSRLVAGGCVVQPGSDHLVPAILKGSVRVFKTPVMVHGLH